MATTLSTVPLGETRLEWGWLANAAVWAGALGYLVDIYDLNVSADFRQDLFQSLGVPSDQTVQTVVDLSIWSRGGLLAGGFLWGILGDRVGRVFSLFGSISLYSVAILFIALFCHSLFVYKVATVVVGLGLAGELGGSVTLVLESLPTTMRTFGVMLVSALGMLGVVLASALAEIVSWRIGFGVGGMLGLALLIFRLHVRESLLFRRLASSSAGRGNWFKLLWPWSTLEKYLACTLLGIAPLFCLYFYGGFTPEIGQGLHLVGDLKINRAAMAMFAGIALGDLLIAWLSYRLKSRKRPLLYFLLASVAIQSAIMLCHGASVAVIYALFVLLGMTAANALYVTSVAEQFGTDLRDTATTTVTNFIRFGAVPLGIVLTSWKGPIGLTHAGFLISLGTLAVAVIALARLKESYGTSIEYVEG